MNQDLTPVAPARDTSMAEPRRAGDAPDWCGALPGWLMLELAAGRHAILHLGRDSADAVAALSARLPRGDMIIPAGQAQNPDVVFADAEQLLPAPSARVHVVLLARGTPIASLPVRLGPLPLVHVALFDTSTGARPCLAVYSREVASGPAGGLAPLPPNLIVLDLRGLEAAACEAALMAASEWEAQQRGLLQALGMRLGLPETELGLGGGLLRELDHLHELLVGMPASFGSLRQALLALRVSQVDQAAEMDAKRREVEAQRAEVSALREELAAVRSELQEQRRSLADPFGRARESDLAATLRAALAEAAQRGRAHNARVVKQEAELRHRVEALQSTLTQVLGSTTWRTGAPIRRLMSRLRGLPYEPIKLPVGGEIRLPRIDLAEPLRHSSEAALRSSSAVRPVISAPAEAPRPKRVAAPGGRRVLIAVENLDRGGLERVVVDVATGLAELGHGVSVAVTRRGGECSAELIAAGLEVRELERDSEAMAAFIESAQPEFAFLNHSYFAVDALKAAGTTMVEIVHNYYVWNQNRRDDYARWISGVRGHIAVSSGVADYHAATFGIPRDRIAVVNNPLNPTGLIRPEPALLKRLRGGHAQALVFVNVAQFYPVKAHHLLISAFIDVHARYPHTRLRLLGEHVDPVVTASMRRRIEDAGLEHAVEMPGFVDRRELSRQLATSHVFVQPSVYEGYSVAMAEAAHFALPLILTRVGGAAETVREEDCGILIPPHTERFHSMSPPDIPRLGLDPTPRILPDLVAAMERMVLDYPAWAERGFIGQARVDAMTLQTVAARYVEIAQALRGPT